MEGLAVVFMLSLDQVFPEVPAKSKILTFLLLPFFISGEASAQSPSAHSVLTTTLTWQQCVEQANLYNPDLLAAEKVVTADQELLYAAYAGFLPSLSANLSYAYGNSTSTTSNTGATTTLNEASSNFTSYNAGLTLSQNLFSGFQDKAKVDNAKATLKVAKDTLNATKAQVSYDLKNAFMAMLYAQNLTRLTDEITRRREMDLKMVQLRFENGGENKGSVMLTQAYLEQAKYDHLQAMDSIEAAKVQLTKMIGREGDEEIEVVDSIPENPPPAQVDYKQLVLDTPTYQEAVGNEQIADAAITQAASNFYPTLSVTGTTGDVGSEWFPKSNHWSMGVALNIPLFSGGRDFFNTRSAIESLRSAAFTRSSTLGQVLIKMKQAYTGYVEAVLKVTVDTAFSESSIVRERIAREKYNNGLETFDDWDLIETDLITRQKTLLQTKHDRVIAEANWELTEGTGVIK